MTQSKQEMAKMAVKTATKMLVELQKTGCPDIVAYAAFGDAFLRMHSALGHTKKDWLKATKQMANHIS